MKIFVKILAVWLCLTTVAYAQNNWIRNENAATYYGSEGMIGNKVSVDRYGRMQCVMPASATSIAKAEDAVHASGDTGVATLFVRNDGGAVLQANGDYGLPVITSTGAVAADIQIANVSSLSQGILKREDDPSASADGVVAIAGIANENGTSFSGTAGDYTPFAVDRNGSLNVLLPKTIPGGSYDFWAVRAEDSAFGDTGAVVMAGGVNNRSFGAYNSTNGDVTPFSVGDKGVLASMLMYDSSLAGGSSPMVLEDSGSADLNAGLNIFAIREASLSTGNTAGADGDFQQLKGSSTGALYVSPSLEVSSQGSEYTLISAATNNSTNIKASAASLYSYSISNTNAAARMVKLYNKATAPTCGTDTPTFRIVVPANGTVTWSNAVGWNFGTGLGICAVTGAADTDNTAVAANDLFVQLKYR